VDVIFVRGKEWLPRIIKKLILSIENVITFRKELRVQIFGVIWVNKTSRDMVVEIQIGINTLLQLK
jgi:hypothetical protein